MNKNVLTIIISVLLSGLAAFGVASATDSRNGAEPGQAAVSADGASYRTVNLAQTDYPDFTYAAESAVDAVVFV